MRKKLYDETQCFIDNIKALHLKRSSPANSQLLDFILACQQYMHMNPL